MNAKHAHEFIAPQADPTSAHWKSHTNKCVLPYGRDLPWHPKPIPWTLKNPPPLTPDLKHGTLQSDTDAPQRRSRIVTTYRLHKQGKK